MTTTTKQAHLIASLGVEVDAGQEAFLSRMRVNPPIQRDKGNGKWDDNYNERRTLGSSDRERLDT